MAAIRNYIANENRVMRFLNQKFAHIRQRLGQRRSIAAERNAKVAKQIIDLLPSVTITSEETDAKAECSVCLDEFVLENVVKQLPCKVNIRVLFFIYSVELLIIIYKFLFLSLQHIFHTECIKDWVESKNSCPMCRGKVVEDSWKNNTHSPLIERLQQHQQQSAQQERRYRRWIPARRSPSRSSTARTTDHSQAMQRRRIVITYIFEHGNYQNE